MAATYTATQYYYEDGIPAIGWYTVTGPPGCFVSIPAPLSGLPWDNKMDVFLGPDMSWVTWRPGGLDEFMEEWIVERAAFVKEWQSFAIREVPGQTGWIVSDGGKTIMPTFEPITTVTPEPGRVLMSVGVAAVVYDPKFDLDNDGVIGEFDKRMFLTYYGQPVNPADPISVACDFNGDGYISISDFTAFMAHYGAVMQVEFANLRIVSYNRR